MWKKGSMNLSVGIPEVSNIDFPNQKKRTYRKRPINLYKFELKVQNQNSGVTLPAPVFFETQDTPSRQVIDRMLKNIKKYHPKTELDNKLLSSADHKGEEELKNRKKDKKKHKHRHNKRAEKDK